MVWSITSGKRLILADGQEVHYSSSRGGVFEHSWTMRGNHVLKVVAHASPPLSPTPGFRQYDFYVDGQTFFSFPKVYRLGLAPNDPRGAPSAPARLAERGAYSSSRRSSGIAAIEAPHNPDEEEAYLQEAIRNSLKENAERAKSNEPPRISEAGQSLLLDFLEEPAPQQQLVPALPPSQPDSYGFATAPGAQNGYGAPPPQGGNDVSQFFRFYFRKLCEFISSRVSCFRAALWSRPWCYGVLRSRPSSLPWCSTSATVRCSSPAAAKLQSICRNPI